MKESAFGKKEVDKTIDVRGSRSLSHALGIAGNSVNSFPHSSSAPSGRSEPASGVEEHKLNKDKLTRFRVSFVKEEIITAHSYESVGSPQYGSNILKVTFKTDGKTSCIRDGVSKVEKL